MYLFLKKIHTGFTNLIKVKVEEKNAKSRTGRKETDRQKERKTKS